MSAIVPSRIVTRNGSVRSNAMSVVIPSSRRRKDGSANAAISMTTRTTTRNAM